MAVSAWSRVGGRDCGKAGTVVSRSIDMRVDGMTGEGGWDEMIILCAASAWDGVKLADRQMAECLVAHAPVLYVNPPVSHLTRLKNPAVAAALARPRLRRLGPRLACLTPVVPPRPTHPAVLPIATLAARHQLHGAVRSLGGRVQAIISTWLFLDVYGVCGERRRVYWWTDDPVGAASLWGHGADRLAAAEQRLASASDLIVAVNEGATERLRDRGFRAAYVPNGCDPALFAGIDDADPAPDVQLSTPIAGFVGHLNSRTDLALLEGVADTSVGLLLIGPTDSTVESRRFERLISRSNVAHLGPRPYDELPSYMKLVDVGLVPYAATEFNRWSFPMKTLEYLAAGRPVVATPLPAIRSLETDLIALAETPEEFAAAVQCQAGLARRPELMARRRVFASTHSWADRADRFARLIAQPA